MYWARTLSCGAPCCGCGCAPGSLPPLVAMVMDSSSAPGNIHSAGLANTGPLHEQGCPAGAGSPGPVPEPSPEPAASVRYRVGAGGGIVYGPPETSTSAGCPAH